ncbi:MAG: nucleoside triphosphate pyrophosphohydrolase [Verrucomicrobiales bacterium]|nr:nucleoside triphosphate pyrophosphohydrolase [Verrucomicrobiales bacterium]
MPHPIPPADQPPVERLRAIMHILRAPGGCPWDAEQTHETLVKHGIEEAYEVADAVETGDRDALVDELGDLLLQPIFHAEIASESGRFDFDDIASAICEKLIRRHPHVFGESEATTSHEVLSQWEKIKEVERAESPGGEKSSEDAGFYLERANEGLPALMAAQKIQNKVAKVGFDWPDTKPVLAKIREELEEVEAELASDDAEGLGEEIGDLLFAVVNLARKQGLESELLLHQANRKFVDRFQKVESGLRAKRRDLADATLEEMDREWESAKQQ